MYVPIERERKRERDRYIDWRLKEKGETEDEMIGWHQWHNGHEFEKTLGDSEGQGSLPCCSPWGHKETKSLIQLSDWTTIYIYVCMYTPAFYLCIHRHRYTYIHIYISLYCLVFFFWNNIYLSLYVNREREKHLKSGWICMKDIQKFYVLFFTLFHKSETTFNRFYFFISLFFGHATWLMVS